MPRTRTIDAPAFEEQLERNKELKRADVELLREWCSKNPHLPSDISDNELALFLHSNYYEVEPAKASLDTFYTFRSHVPEFFADRDPVGSRALRKMFDTLCMITLQGTTAEGYAVMFGKLLDRNSGNYNYDDNIRYFGMSVDVLMHEKASLSPGLVIVFDVEGASLGHAAHFSPSSFKKFLFYLTKALPVRLKALHYINTSSVMDFMLTLMKPFMNKSLMDLLHLHSSPESLDKFVPLHILPNEYGGKAGALLDLHKAQIAKLEAYRDWFLEDERCGRVDESKRIGEPMNPTKLYGGSRAKADLRKLDID
ncbi:hypothetical protein TKK_0013982 [Trichogramma kaykai]|uniref:CRAL-TRIO domain-containing protein n=1 Tax=Trichogramma kaykai TaxID=54128 RepID=A0ABD2WGM8_9HYME